MPPGTARALPRGQRLAGLALLALLAAAIIAQALLLGRLARDGAQLAGTVRPAAATAATQLMLAQQALHGALLEHRLGAPDIALRQGYEVFAARLEHMRNTAQAPELARLPGLATTLASAGMLTARVDALLEQHASETMPAAVVETLQRAVPPLREPLSQLRQAVDSAQVLAHAGLLRRLDMLQLRTSWSLAALAAIAAAALLAFGLGWRALRRAGAQYRLLAARAAALGAEAEQAVRGRLDALAFVAAETNARLAGVGGSLARALEPGELDPRLRETLQGLRTQTDDLLVLANDLADLARLEAGALRLRPAPFRLADALEQAADLLRHRFRAGTLNIALADLAALPPWWLGDAARVRQLVQHLGSAAAELRAHGTIVLAAERLAPPAGSEIAEQLVLQAEVAAGAALLPGEPDAARDAAHSLALTLVRTLSAAMGGHFVREDRADGGCRLRVVLPLSACAPPQSAAGDPAALAPPLDILVVDDVVLNRRLLGAVLERFGHRTEMANDGLEALRAVQQRRFDVVLMDIQMPNLDGLAATRLMRALPPPAGLVPVIAVTAAGEPEDRAAYDAAGMNGFVPKPVATSELLAALAAAIAGRAPAAGADADAPPDLAVGPLMDRQTLGILRSTLAADELARLIAGTELEAGAALRAAEAAAAGGDGAGLAAAAAAIAQAAEAVGAVRVVAIARAMQATAAGGPVARAAAHLPALRRALGETLAAISRGPGGPPASAPALAASPPRQ